MLERDDFQETLAILETELDELGEKLQVAYASRDITLHTQVMRRVEQIGEILGNFEIMARY